MSYFSGQASSYQELLNVLVTACVEHGWTWADGILSKNNAFIQFEVSLTEQAYTKGAGIIMKGGTGKSGSSLVNPSEVRPRLGRIGNPLQFNFPIDFNIHITTSPDEVYLIVQTGIDIFYYLAFGISNILLPGSGLWLVASAPYEYIPADVGFAISAISGGARNYYHYSGPFWNTSVRPTPDAMQYTMQVGLKNKKWHIPGYEDDLNAIRQAIPQIGRSPNNWNSETLLIPIRICSTVESQKTCIVAELTNSRYLRIDNYEPNQLIVLGGERWKIYPFYKKSIVDKDGDPSEGVRHLHTGTFGWAIRYDGP